MLVGSDQVGESFFSFYMNNPTSSCPLHVHGITVLASSTARLTSAHFLSRVLLFLGHRVSAHISATIEKPKPDRPFEGLLQVSAEVNPLASFVYETGRWVDEASTYYVSWVVFNKHNSSEIMA